MTSKCYVSERDYRRHFLGDKKMNGTVKTLKQDKKFGFIKGEDGREFFFHASALKNVTFGELRLGQEVTFEDAEGEKGPRAEDIFV